MTIYIRDDRSYLYKHYTAYIYNYSETINRINSYLETIEKMDNTKKKIKFCFS